MKQFPHKKLLFIGLAILVATASVGTFFYVQSKSEKSSRPAPSLIQFKPNPQLNLVLNPVMTQMSQGKPLYWSFYRYGNNDASPFITTGHKGNGLKIIMRSWTNGDAKWGFDAKEVHAGIEYHFSDWYQASGYTELIMDYVLTNGQEKYITVKRDIPPSNDWKQLSFYWQIPSGVKEVSVFHQLTSPGFLTVSDYYLASVAVTDQFLRPILSLTFDDGVSSQYTQALPLLKRFGIPATFYVISGRLNSPGYLTTAQVQELDSAGMQIGSHTVHHPNLTMDDQKQIDEELEGSQQSLDQLIGTQIVDFATPYGLYNGTVVQEVKKFYVSHRGVEAGFNSPYATDTYDLKVQNLGGNTSLQQVEQWIDEAVASRTWLILVLHKEDNQPGSFETSSKMLAGILQYAKSSGIEALTVREALEEVVPQLKN